MPLVNTDSEGEVIWTQYKRIRYCDFFRSVHIYSAAEEKKMKYEHLKQNFAVYGF